jgi:hypothetical protein
MIENDWTWLKYEDDDDEEEEDDDFVEVSMYRMCVAQWHGEELMATLLGCCGDTKFDLL